MKRVDEQGRGEKRKLHFYVVTMLSSLKVYVFLNMMLSVLYRKHVLICISSK